MFLLFFALFVLIFTVFENILLGVIFLIVSIFFLWIYYIIRRKKIYWKLLAYIICWFFLALGSFLWKEYRYYESMDSRFRGNDAIVWTGIISDIFNQWKYVFEYKNKKYLLYSKKEYRVWDEIWLVGRIQINMLWCVISNNCRQLPNSLSANPLFSWWFDYPKRLKMKGRAGTIYENNSLLINNGNIERWKDGKMWIIKKAKKGIQEKVLEAYGKNRISGLILGMLIWDKSQIPEEDYQNFINSWLVHLIAVSGGNILMIVVFLQCVLIFIPFYLRLGLILLTIIGYSLICGLDSSVFRAVLMGGLTMVALFFGREINIWRLMSISVIIMLIINPYFLAYDVGFLLSYSALIGIVYFQNNDKSSDPVITPPYPLWNKGGTQKEEKNVVQKSLVYVYKSYISSSIWASIGIFPIIIFFMGQINIIWVVGNLLVLPVVPFVMIYGFVSIWLYSWLWWWWLIWIEIFFVQYIYKISELLSQYGVYLHVSWIWIKYLILVIFVWFFLYRKINKNKQRS